MLESLLLIKVQAFRLSTLLETLTQVSFSKICEIFQNRSSRSQLFFKIVILQNFAIFTAKHLCWSLLLIKWQGWGPASLLKRDSNLWNMWNIKNLRNFSEHLFLQNTCFYRTPPILKNIHERLLIEFLTWSIKAS